jgi:hypothetical protein
MPYQSLATFQQELFDNDPEVARAYFQVVLEEYLQEGTVSFQDVQQALRGWLERVGGVDTFAKQHNLDASAVQDVVYNDNMPIAIVKQVLSPCRLNPT